MADFLDAKRKEIDERLKELRPLVEEYQRLEAASAALAGVETAPDGRRGGRRRRSGGSNGTGRRGRRRGSGQRSQQALELVTARPGISVAELAEQMGIAPNYLYRVLPALQQEGKLTKQGRGWYPA